MYMLTLEIRYLDLDGPLTSFLSQCNDVIANLSMPPVAWRIPRRQFLRYSIPLARRYTRKTGL